MNSFTDSYLVIDTGSSSMKAILFSADGEILFRAQSLYSMSASDGGAVSMDAVVFRDALCGLVRQAADFAFPVRRIRSLSFTSQRSSLLPLDRNGRPLSEIFMWYDKRSSHICDDLATRSGNDIHRISGMKISPLCTAPKILYLMQEYPDLYDSAFRLAGIHDYLLFLTTGNFVTDTTLASRTAMMDITKRQWSPELLALYGIDGNKLCTMLDPGSIAGTVTKEFSALTGCPAGIPVITAGGDQQNGILGQGMTAPGSAAINSGTGSFISTLLENPIFDPSLGLSLNTAVTPGCWVLEGSVLGSGSVFQWLINTCYHTGASFDEADKDISSVPPGAEGLLCIPTLTGDGTPSWDPYARGGLFNLGLHHTKAHIARAFLEGIAFKIWDCYNILTQSAPRIRQIRSSGGMTGFPVFNQMLADMLNRPLTVSSRHEATAAGALVVTLAALGKIGSCGEYFEHEKPLPEMTYEPDGNVHKTYIKQFLARKYVIETLDYRKISYYCK